MSEPLADPGLLTPTMRAHLGRLYRRERAYPGYWQETVRAVNEPLSSALQALIDLELVRASDKGRCGPLGLPVGVWIVRITERGQMIARLYGLEKQDTL